MAVAKHRRKVQFEQALPKTDRKVSKTIKADGSLLFKDS